jgi:ATP-dependent helicase HrpB
MVALAYPDRIAMSRPGDGTRYLTTGGKGAVLPEGDPLATAPMIVAADLDGDVREAMVRLALPVTEADIRALHADALERAHLCEWSRRERTVVARERLMLGALPLEDRRWVDAPPDAVASAMLDGVRDLGIEALPWTPAARRLAGRVEWLRGQGADLADFSADGLTGDLEEWLTPFLGGIAKAGELARVDLMAALDARLGYEGRQALDRLAPASFTAPTGTRLAIDYSGGAPSVSVRLQEMFGTALHPTIGPTRTPLVFELLSPGHRPVQKTADLPDFWANSYADVRRDMRGRYPRHPWPEDPAAADPTRRVKPRGS